MKKSLYLLALGAILFSCTNQKTNKEMTTNNQPEVPKLTSDIMTPEVLWSFGRIGEPTLSPDKSTVLYAITYFNMEENKSYRDLYTVSVEGGEAVKITSTPEKESSAQWRPDGKKIGYLSSKSGEMQLWEMNPDGTEPIQISEIKGGITGFKYSPDGSKVLFTADVKFKDTVHDLFPDLPKANAYLENDLMYKHWDEWVQTVPHPFVADLKDGKLANPIDLLEGEPYESPMKPFGGMEQLDWSPDGKTIAYTCRKKTGKEYAISTNSDIYFYDVATKQTMNKTEGMMGYDQNPVFSPDGKWLAWESMERDGYEADKNRLFLMNLETGVKTDQSLNFDQNSSNLAWSADSKSLYFISCWHALTDVYRLDIADQKISQITKGVHDYAFVSEGNGKLIGMKHSMSQPDELYAIDPASGAETQLSFVNKPILDQLTLAKVEERWITTTDNKQMHTWVVYPPHFDPAKKYPTLLFCEGGPQSTVSQFWSYRWNFQQLAANGYIVVAPNRRGLPGFGKEWLEQISGDYGGQNMKDYLSAIDAVAKEPFVDKDKLGCVGASYGGFSVYWLAGHHDKRFKAFISHDGMFNLEQQYLETEEMWFVNWDLGGPYWDKSNAVAQRSYANSPHKFVDKWDTPILVIHGEKDYRILASQGMAAFNAAVLRGVPAQMLIFPDENHWVLQPQDGILWQRVFKQWLDKWLK
ncbi:MAG: S9 family peptidase [Prolixibacteraceae bacterium]|nr:S9 family peptidase [Prolixibacteraceae bacterium]